MNVLCVVAHPDDEVLGCGGTLAKHAEAGDDVSIHILCSRHLGREAGAAAAILGAQDIEAEGVPGLNDQAFDASPLSTLCRYVEFQNHDPDIVYTHHPGDLNLDHALTARAVLTAFRPKPGEKPRTILACEVLSSTEWTFPQVFQPNWFSELTWDQVKKKQDAMRCYPSELVTAPLNEPQHPRSMWGIRAAAESRGLQCGRKYAEAFQLLRRGPC